ncbi:MULTISPECIES: SOS response-associated peptidase [Microbacterium]|uniref:SOS response-associated peptidase n=1 Tax=Microbacterium TaxID=33882 RepID=UPI0010F69C23|nr:SOS response-associated peptidase [Microbacterium sp. 4NA327F11]MCK9914665.1 SOS response-associated peptidase [Microbacteriaceae bacterium K1510]
MCGRFVVANVGSELVGVLRADTIADDLPQTSYNVAPTMRAAIVLDSAKTDPPTRRVEAARWGLVPAWAKDPSIGTRAFNARSEEVEDKPMFRAALVKRRAIVPATGYFEWQQTPDGKVPHYIHPADDAPLFFAGLYEWWKDPSKADDDPSLWLLSFTILTRSAVGRLGSIHERMPLFVDADFADAWLDTDLDNIGDVLDAAIDAAPDVAESLADWPVASQVGNVRNDSPANILPVGP